jgi:death-on-curing protein
MNRGLDPEGLLILLGESTGPRTRIRDASILYASTQRPGAVIMESPVFSDLSSQAGALLHSIIRWEPLDMWNASFAWRAIRALVKANGCTLDMSPWERMTLTDDLMIGALDDVVVIGARLKPCLRLK